MPSQKIKLSPRIAQEFLDSQSSNRPINRRHVQYLADSMTDQEWEPGIAPALLFSDQGKMMDGQHRCSAVVLSGVTIDATVVTGVDPAKMLVIDTGKKRSFADNLHIQGVENSREVSAAAAFIYGFEEHGRLGQVVTNRSPRFSELQDVVDSHPGIHRYAGHTSRFSKIGLSGSFVIAAMTIFNEIDPEESDVFFELLATGADLHKGSPILSLRNAYIANKNRKVSKMAPQIKGALMIKAFNFWRQGVLVERLSFKSGGAKVEKFPVIEVPETFEADVLDTLLMA